MNESYANITIFPQSRHPLGVGTEKRKDQEGEPPPHRGHLRAAFHGGRLGRSGDCRGAGPEAAAAEGAAAGGLYEHEVRPRVGMGDAAAATGMDLCVEFVRVPDLRSDLQLCYILKVDLIF